MKQGLDGFTFSGTATESTGFPIVASMSGTVTGGADGNIYGGSIDSGSGAATTGRPPEIQRNSQPGPGIRNIDFRITREIPIHNKMSMQFIGEAFNLMNHEIYSSVNSTFATYYGPTSSSCTESGTVPAGSTFYGCIKPYSPSSPAGAFGVRTGTNSVLYGPRQIQLSVKFNF